MRSSLAVPVLVMLGVLPGCATLVRSPTAVVEIESRPQAKVSVVSSSATPHPSSPTAVEVQRDQPIEVRTEEAGHRPHVGTIPRQVNGAWRAWDIATCIVPILLCVPLVTDSFSGAWFDVAPRYRADLVRLEPLPNDDPPSWLTAGAAPENRAPIDDGERFAAARAAYEEGMTLRSAGKPWAAAARLRVAAELVDSPLHLAKLAEAYAATGQLVAAFETYDSLASRGGWEHTSEEERAIANAARARGALRPRLARLRIEVQPAEAKAVARPVLNGRAYPREILGLTRFVDPGTYRVEVEARGWATVAPSEVGLDEGETREVTVTLQR